MQQGNYYTCEDDIVFERTGIKSENGGCISGLDGVAVRLSDLIESGRRGTTGAMICTHPSPTIFKT